jgi:hypothetical protein
MSVTPGKVQAALRAESRKLDRRYRGVHVFEPIHETPATAGCNWSAGFHCRGSDAPLDELRDALERVQAKLPIVAFSRAQLR